VAKRTKLAHLPGNPVPRHWIKALTAPCAMLLHPRRHLLPPCLFRGPSAAFSAGSWRDALSGAFHGRRTIQQDGGFPRAMDTRIRIAANGAGHEQGANFCQRREAAGSPHRFCFSKTGRVTLPFRSSKRHAFPTSFCYHSGGGLSSVSRRALVTSQAHPQDAPARALRHRANPAMLCLRRRR